MPLIDSDAQILFSRLGDEKSLKSLWRTVFGDGDEYIDAFFRRLYFPGSAVVAASEDDIASAMYMIPAKALMAVGKSLSCCYLYALATLPEYRGRGLGALVLDEITKAAFSRGFDCVCLSPAEESLFAYYEKLGFSACFGFEEKAFKTDEIITPPCALKSAEVTEYEAVRENLLKEIPHLEYSPEALLHQKKLCLDSGGDLWVFEGGCMSAERSYSGDVIIKELLCRDASVPLAVSAVASLMPANRYILRSPPLGSSSRKNGLARFAAETISVNAWLPFAFD